MKARLTYNSKEHISYILLKLRFIKAQSRETLKIFTGKKHPQINLKAFKKFDMDIWVVGKANQLFIGSS